MVTTAGVALPRQPSVARPQKNRPLTTCKPDTLSYQMQLSLAYSPSSLDLLETPNPSSQGFRSSAAGATVGGCYPFQQAGTTAARAEPGCPKSQQYLVGVCSQVGALPQVGQPQAGQQQGEGGHLDGGPAEVAQVCKQRPPRLHP